MGRLFNHNLSRLLHHSFRFLSCSLSFPYFVLLFCAIPYTMPSHPIPHRDTYPKVWGWLGADSATANDVYARFLPKNTYSVSDQGLGQSFTQLSAGGVVGIDDGGGSRKVSGVRLYRLLRRMRKIGDTRNTRTAGSCLVRGRSTAREASVETTNEEARALIGGLPLVLWYR